MSKMIDDMTVAESVRGKQIVSIVPPFWHNANFEKVGIIDRGDYRQRKILMFYYEIGTDDTGRGCDYRQSFHMRGL